MLFVVYVNYQRLYLFLKLVRVSRCGDARGSIMVNSRPREMKTFRKMCRYIMQEDLLQPALTVSESMEIAADLKLGYTISKKTKLDSVTITTRPLPIWPIL